MQKRYVTLCSTMLQMIEVRSYMCISTRLCRPIVRTDGAFHVKVEYVHIDYLDMLRGGATHRNLAVESWVVVDGKCRRFGIGSSVLLVVV